MNVETQEGLGQSEPVVRPFKLDHRMWCLIAFALLGLVVFLLKDHEVFPEASINLKLSKPEIATLAKDWARTCHFEKDKLIESTTFSYDSSAKTYLEFELGTGRANDLMKNTIPVWYWQTRLRKEFDQEQFSSYISPTGDLIGL
ncbi:MAG: hypothetical protein ACRD3W_27525, partial [Terriglobales bacterium]